MYHPLQHKILVPNCNAGWLLTWDIVVFSSGKTLWSSSQASPSQQMEWQYCWIYRCSFRLQECCSTAIFSVFFRTRLIPPSFVNPWQIAWICQTSSISIRWHRRVRFPLNNSFLNIKKWIKHFSSKHLISGNYSPNSSCRTIEVHYLHCPIYYSNVWTTYLTSALCCHRK